MKTRRCFLIILAFVSMFVVNSCSQNELLQISTEDDYITATFNISSGDGMGTRANDPTIGKATMIDKVACSVYDSNGNEMALYEVVPFVDGQATYNVRLAKGQAYRVAFFAYNEAAKAYKVDDLKNIEVIGDQKIKP